MRSTTRLVLVGLIALAVSIGVSPHAVRSEDGSPVSDLVTELRIPHPSPCEELNSLRNYLARLDEEYDAAWDTFDRYREETFLPLREEFHEMALGISGDFGIPYISVEDLKERLEGLEREARDRGDNAEADRIQSILSDFESRHQELLDARETLDDLAQAALDIWMEKNSARSGLASLERECNLTRVHLSVADLLARAMSDPMDSGDSGESGKDEEKPDENEDNDNVFTGPRSADNQAPQPGPPPQVNPALAAQFLKENQTAQPFTSETASVEQDTQSVTSTTAELVQDQEQENSFGNDTNRIRSYLHNRPSRNTGQSGFPKLNPVQSRIQKDSK